MTDAPHLTLVKPAVTWPDELFDVLKRADIRQVGYVPDAGHSRLIALCKADPDIHDVSLTTEEEGIALAAGAWLGGQRAALLMQSSGVGNCVNMLSLIRACRFPMLMLVTMRGEWEEFNPWQVPMGAIVKPTLEAVRHPRHDGRVARSGRAAGAVGRADRVRRRPRRRGAAVAEADRPQGVEMTDKTLERRAAMATLLADRPKNLFVVPGLGSTTWDAAAAAGGNDDRDFYLWGAMGGAAMIGLGLALAQPKLRVAVITGDGEMLMGLGSLATIGVKQPPNLFVVVFDNGLYGETGMQASHTQNGVDLCNVARACGFERVLDVYDQDGLNALASMLRKSNRMLFARVRISPRGCAALSAGEGRRASSRTACERPWRH